MDISWETLIVSTVVSTITANVIITQRVISFHEKLDEMNKDFLENVKSIVIKTVIERFTNNN